MRKLFGIILVVAVALAILLPTLVAGSPARGLARSGVRRRPAATGWTEPCHMSASSRRCAGNARARMQYAPSPRG